MAPESGVAPNGIFFRCSFPANRPSFRTVKPSVPTCQQQSKRVSSMSARYLQRSCTVSFCKVSPPLRNVFSKLSRQIAVCPAVKRLCVLSEKKVARIWKTQTRLRGFNPAFIISLFGCPNLNYFSTPAAFLISFHFVKNQFAHGTQRIFVQMVGSLFNVQILQGLTLSLFASAIR